MASSSVSSSSSLSSNSSSSSSSTECYDVFLSFRREDTHGGFISDLHQALKDKGVHTFIRDETLEIGERNDENLRRAIESSAICIVILSSGYGDSKLCLMELAKMVRCNKKIFPIFYHVDPSDVRHQRGPFEKVFKDYNEHYCLPCGHEHRIDEDKVTEWKLALTHAGNIKGFDLDKQYSGSESKLIGIIVKKVLHFTSTPFGATKYTVGMDSRIEKMMKLLNIEAKDVLMAGIHGMGGIGKTTLAMALYNRISNMFDVSCFILNVRDASRKYDGLVTLQRQLICKILNDDNQVVRNIHHGSAMIRKRCRHKKVLIILDDIDHENQLNALAGGRDWFGQGSRIIITTRDKHVLNVHKVGDHEMYEDDKLNEEESLRLFSYHAFVREQPLEEYRKISQEMASITGGLPLALEVFGSKLFDKRSIQVWQEMLEKLKCIPFQDVSNRLEISFDGLDQEEKKIFLDIACFFVSDEREHVIDILKGCGFSSTLTVEVLLHKSLLKIDQYDRLAMHDQLRDMATYIVRRENFGELGKCSRLWDHDITLDVLMTNKGTGKTEAIVFVGDFKKQMAGEMESLNIQSFATMSSLRLLYIDGVILQGDFNRMPKSLRSFKWMECPLESLPNNFDLKEIVYLDLYGSKIVELWDEQYESENKVSENKIFDLRFLYLHYCSELVKTPDFFCLPNLEKLSLSACWNISSIPESIGHLTRLLVLDLSGCGTLTKLPESIGNMKSLTTLYLNYSAIQELPDSIGSLKNLKILAMPGCHYLGWLPDSIGDLTKLEELGLRNCESLRALPGSIGNLQCLPKLDLSYVGINELPDSIGGMTKIKELKFNGCPSIRTLPDSIVNIKGLVKLDFSCSGLEKLPDSIRFLENMKILCMDGCSSFGSLPDSVGDLTKLEELSLQICVSLKTLPDSIGNMKNLRYLDIAFTGIKELPDSIGSLKNLKRLNVIGCMKLRGPLPLWELKCLESLNVGDMWVGEEEDEDEGYFKIVPENMVEMSVNSQETQEFRRILFKEQVGEVNEFELLIRVRDQERVIQVGEYLQSVGKQWLRFIFPKECIFELVTTLLHDEHAENGGSSGSSEEETSCGNDEQLLEPHDDS